MGNGALKPEETADYLDPAERQKHPRSLVFCSAQLTMGPETGPCDVLNVSLGGAKVRLASEMDIASHMSLTIEPFGVFQGRVAWQDGLFLGIEFHEDVDRVGKLIWALLDNPDTNKEKRGAPRNSVLWTGWLHGGARGAECRVLNVSPYGAKIRLLEPLDDMTQIGIKLDRFGEFPADVIWRQDEFLGIKFRDDPQDIARIFGDAIPNMRQWIR